MIVNTTTNTYEHHFKGSLDDLRIWNLYKDEKSVNEGMRMKADSTAIGLLAYYPFEAHGVTEQNIPVVRFSLKDMKKQPATSSPVPDAIAVIGDVEVASVDNPEDRGMVEEVMMNSAIGLRQMFPWQMKSTFVMSKYFLISHHFEFCTHACKIQFCFKNSRSTSSGRGVWFGYFSRSGAAAPSIM